MKSWHTGQVRIVIVDDHPIVRQGLRVVLEAELCFSVVGEANGYNQAMSVVAETQPDIAVVDVGLQGRNGIELTRDLRNRDDTLRILVLSMHDERVYAQRALRAGANGFIMKTASGKPVVAAIRRIMDGYVYLSDELISTSVKGRYLEHTSDPLATLTDRELEILDLIGNGRSTRQIADMLFISIKTVESHRANIKKKLGLISGFQLLQFAILNANRVD